MKALVINLETAAHRRAFQIDQAARCGLDLEFVAAKDATELAPEYCQASANEWTRPIPRKDIACYQSHRRAWERVVTLGQKCLILEDDAILAPAIGQVLAFIKGRQDPWNVIYDLEFVPRPHVIARRHYWSDCASGATAARLFENRHGLAAYVLGPEAAARLLAETEKFVLVDAFLWGRRWARHYQIEPAPAAQSNELPGVERMERGNPAQQSQEVFRPASLLKSQRIAIWNELRKVPYLSAGLVLGRSRMIACRFEEF